MNFRDILASILRDRIVHAGVSTSGVSLLGSHAVAQTPLHSAVITLMELQPWVAFFAAVFGGLSAFATFVYVCIRIKRLLASPKALD